MLMDYERKISTVDTALGFKQSVYCVTIYAGKNYFKIDLVFIKLDGYVFNFVTQNMFDV